MREDMKIGFGLGVFWSALVNIGILLCTHQHPLLSAISFIPAGCMIVLIIGDVDDNDV